MKTSVLIVFYSMYGHIHAMAEAEAEGVREIEGAEVTLLQVPELVPPEVLMNLPSPACKGGMSPG